jgi:ATP/maltotriose-dependent transcriptional regulator MalT
MQSDALERARRAYGDRQWDKACHAFAEAREHGDLDAADLAAFADAAWWLGHTDESLRLSEEVYRHHVQGNRTPQAAGLAIEMGFLWLLRGEPTVGSGWINRATRLLADAPECAEHGYLLYLEVMDAQQRGDPERAIELSRRMQDLGDRHGDPTLRAVGLVLQGVVMIRQGRVDEGLAVLDEAMLPVRAGDVSPDWTGNIYCQLMALFIELADIPRARAWTDATERWCDGFSNAAMFRGICRVHRAQLLHLQGDWATAEQRAAQACRDLADMNVEVVAEGHYVIGELRRLRDDRAGAEEAYGLAHELGRDPQPGLARLRLAQGRTGIAASALDAALAATNEPATRAPLLAARVDVAEAAGEVTAAADAARQLTEVAETFGTPGLVAASRLAAGTASLVAGEPERALPALRDACRQWRKLDASYDTARTRARLARALEAMGDAEAAERERGLAKATFAELGAVHDLRVLEEHQQDGAPPGGLTPREAEVLALVATGQSNREIARALTISERTVERHLSNMFAKLGLSSRTEAAGFAFAHGLASPARD